MGVFGYHVDRTLSFCDLLGPERTQDALWQQLLSEQLDFGDLWRHQTWET